MDPVDALVACDGVASWRRLRRLGVTAHALQGALTVGRLERLDRGVYAVPHGDATRIGLVRSRGVLSCASAAQHHGLALLRSPSLHITVPRGWSHRGGSGPLVHRRDLGPDEHDGIGTSLLRTALDCGRELDFREAVVVSDAAVRAGLGVHELQTAARAATGPGSTALRRVVAAVDGNAESMLESLQRLCVPAGHEVRAQVGIAGVGRVDFLIDGWLVVEADGFEYHSSRASYVNDRRRNNTLVELGYAVLRFSYEQLVHHPEAVTTTIDRVLTSGGSMIDPGHHIGRR